MTTKKYTIDAICRTKSLTALQKMLLCTNGSVTALLEAHTSHPVKVRPLRQKEIKPPKKVNKLLNLENEEIVIERFAILEDAVTKEKLIYAVSYTRLKHLPPRLKREMMRTEKPIGKILLSNKIEHRRELISVCERSPSREETSIFGVNEHAKIIARNYRIFFNDRPMMVIWESVPRSCLK
jgi:beta-ribofuranosylaminobenzene 5'-phosphate synthase